MILGNQVEWALHCMTVLAGMPEDVLVPAKTLAEFHGVPKEYLSKCLQFLSNEGLVETTLGPKGGYKLVKTPDKITLLDIVEAVEGTKKTFQCQEIRKNNPCIGKTHKSFSSACSIAAVMYQADNAWRDVLRKKKLSDVIQDLEKKLQPEDFAKNQDWFAGKIAGK